MIDEEDHMTTRSEKVEFAGATGEMLAARLDLPAGEPVAYALFAHCFTCSKDLFAVSRIAQALTRHGIAVLRFDFTGLGASEGEFANTDFSSNVEDLTAAAAWLRAEKAAPKLLLGHSLGGAAALVAAGEIAEVEAVCTIGAPADPADVMRHLTGAAAEIATKGEAEVQLAGRPFRISRQFLDDLHEHDLATKVHALRKALLIFHSPIDQVVGIDNARRIFDAAMHPKSFVSLDDADHLLSRQADAVYVADVIAAWAARYIGSVEAVGTTVAPADAPGEPGAVTVEETGHGTYENAISVGGRHVMIADEPVDVGGGDAGPGPYDFLLAALGACKSITMRMYADRKGLALERARVTLRHRKIHAEDCADCESKDGKIDEIAIAIALDGDLDAETRQRIYEIADRCPVHRTLMGEIKIRSSLEDA